MTENSANPKARLNRLEFTHSCRIRRARQNITLNNIALESTHSHRVRQLRYVTLLYAYLALIHTLSQSATIADKQELERPWALIHALSQSATKSDVLRTPTLFSFNPRTLAECDEIYLLNLLEQTGFNPRTLAECDSKYQQALMVFICYF